MRQILAIGVLIFLSLNSLKAKVWNVSPTGTYTLPSQVASLVTDGDTVNIAGGVYNNDASKWNKKNLKIFGLGTGNNRTILRYTGDIPNGKGIFVFENPGISDNPYLENIVFDGAQVSNANGANGAGIRFQANNITIRNCKFTNCQNGILEGNAEVTTSNVDIQNCEFFNNGYQFDNDSQFSGYEHHIYISTGADTLILKNNWFHRPRGQANSIKTRAQRSFILYNFIDEEDGYGSYELNIAQGGLNIVMGNIIIQGKAGANHNIIGYDDATNALEDFYFVYNTVINQYSGAIGYFFTTPKSGIKTFKVYNNIFASIPTASTTIFVGNTPIILDTAKNVISNNYLTFGFKNPAASDFNLTSAATSVIDKSVTASSTNTNYSLLPINMYQAYNLPLLPRIIFNVPDIGAYEYKGNTPVIDNFLDSKVSIYPNPSNGNFTIFFDAPNVSANLTAEIFDLQGKLVFHKPLNNKLNAIDLVNIAKGLYFLKIISGIEIICKKIVID